MLQNNSTKNTVYQLNGKWTKISKKIIQMLY